MEDRQQQAEVVYRSGVKGDCLAQALVLETAGIGNETYRIEGEFRLAVALRDVARARAELDSYERENRDWRGDMPTPAPHAGGWTGVWGYATVLIAVAVAENLHAFGANWHSAGMTRAGLIRNGEVWRVVSALTLHSDLSHLLGNLLIGGLIGLFASQLLGSGLAWVSILMAGAAGNLLNAWIRQPTHASVGASTAVFAALGILAAYSWRGRRHVRVSGFKRWAPLVSGVVLLGFLGAGGERTDVGAHVAGFVSGALIGVLYASLGDRVVFGARVQFVLGVGALALLATAWALALTAHAQPA